MRQCHQFGRTKNGATIGWKMRGNMSRIKLLRITSSANPTWLSRNSWFRHRGAPTMTRFVTRGTMPSQASHNFRVFQFSVSFPKAASIAPWTSSCTLGMSPTMLRAKCLWMVWMGNWSSTPKNW